MSQAAEKPRSRRYSIAHLALLTPWVVLVIGAWQSIEDNSFLWHIRAGSLQAESAEVLTEDPFSFTMLGEPWRTQSWLAELLYDWAEGFTGLGFVPYLLLVVTTLTFIAFGLVAYQNSHSVPATAFVVVLSVLALVSFLVPRPVLFSYLLFALVVLAWDRPSTRWTVPFLFWIWASVHASFVIGLAYISLALIMNREWREIPKVVAAGLATMATAHGVGVARFLLDFGANSDALQYLTEWRKPGLLDTVFLPFVGGVTFLVIGAFRQRISPRHLWLIVPFIVLAMSSVRVIPVAWIALVPLVARSLADLKVGSHLGQRPQLAAIFASFVLVLPFFLREGAQLSEDRFPIAAVSVLQDAPTFHDDVTGGFLIWAAGPEKLVYIDDRAELYGDRLSELVEVRAGILDWKPIFERDGIEQALLRADESLVASLEQEGWSAAYRDDDFVILSR